uniref:S1 motif domain-containing protein n=1 Tax=Strongyloides venezuelensis TaxID=75913 RepID=A0A0K0FUL1_STRVS
MVHKKCQNSWRVDNIGDLFNDISFRDTESFHSNSENLNSCINKQNSVEELDDNTDQEEKNKKKQLYVGVMRQCDVEGYLRSFIGNGFCFYHNLKISKQFIRYPKKLKLYYAFKNEVDLIHHSEVKYIKSQRKFSFRTRFAEKKFFNSFGELVRYCNSEVKNICC